MTGAHLPTALAVAAAFAWAASYVLTGQLAVRVGAMTLLTIELPASLLLGALLLSQPEVRRELMEVVVPSRVNLILAAGDMAMIIIAKSAMVWAIVAGRGDVLTATLAEVSYPLFIVLISWAFIQGFRVSTEQAVAGVLIAAGLCVLVVRPQSAS